MPQFPDNGCCPICHCHEFRPVIVKVNGGFRETELQQCGACSAVFKTPAQFARALEYRLTSGAAAALAILDPQPEKSVTTGNRTMWMRSSERPIGDTDVGKFIVGVGYGGWFGGLISKTHALVVDQSDQGRPLMAANAAIYYLLVDPPPPISG